MNDIWSKDYGGEPLPTNQLLADKPDGHKQVVSTLLALFGIADTITPEELCRFSIIYPRWADSKKVDEYKKSYHPIFHPSSEDEINSWEGRLPFSSYFISCPIEPMKYGPACFVSSNGDEGINRLSVFFKDEEEVFTCPNLDPKARAESIDALIDSFTVSGHFPMTQFVPI